MVRQMALMGKSGFRRDAADRQFPFPEQYLRAVDAALDHVLMHWQSHCFAESGLDVRHADPRNGGQFLERKILREVVLHVSDDLFELCSESAFTSLRSGRG